MIPLEAGEHEGGFEDGTRWALIIQPHEAVGAAASETLALVPYEVEVRVTGARGGEVTLRSLRLGPRQ